MINIFENKTAWKGNDFYATVYKYFPETGVHVEIKGSICENKFRTDEEQLELTYTLQEPVIEAIMSRPDELGNNVQYIEKDPTSIPSVVKSWLNLNHSKGENEFVIYPRSKAYPLVNYALVNAGLIPEANHSAFGFDWDDLEGPIQEFNCQLYVEKRKGTSRSYYVPIPQKE
jgi:hypothetical protein